MKLPLTRIVVLQHPGSMKLPPWMIWPKRKELGIAQKATPSSPTNTNNSKVNALNTAAVFGPYDGHTSYARLRADRG